TDHLATPNRHPRRFPAAATADRPGRAGRAGRPAATLAGSFGTVRDLLVPPPQELPVSVPADPAALTAAFAERDYLVDRGLATALHLALRLGRPLLLEGDA